MTSSKCLCSLRLSRGSDKGRCSRLLRNFLRGDEDSKLDSFLQILKQRFFTKRAAEA